MNTRCMLVLAILSGVLAGCGREEVRRLEAQNVRLGEANRELAAQLEALKKAADSHDASQATEFESARKQLADLKAQFDEATAAALTRQEIYDKTARDLADAQKQVTQLSEALHQSVAQASAAAERSRAEIESLKARITDLQAKLDRAIEKAGEDALKRLLPP